MTLRQLVILIGIATCLMWAGWFWTLISIDPSITNFIGFTLFFGTLFLALTGTIALSGIVFRRWRGIHGAVFHTVSLSFRQSIILSALLTAVLILQGQRWLSWWLILILFFVAIVLEFIVLSRQKGHIADDVKFEVTEIDAYVPPEPKFKKRGLDESWDF